MFDGVWTIAEPTFLTARRKFGSSDGASELTSKIFVASVYKSQMGTHTQSFRKNKPFYSFDVSAFLVFAA